MPTLNMKLTPTNKRFALAGMMGLVAMLFAAGFSFGQHDFGLPTKMPHSLEQTWKLGGKIGLAASAYSFVNGPDDPKMELIEAEFAAAKSMAKMMDVDLPELPEFQNKKSKFAASVVHYMLKQLVDKTGEELKDKYNHRHGVMFELAVKSYVLSITYHPQIDDRLTFAKVIADRSKQARISERMYKPLVDALKNQKPYDEVKQQLFKFHQEVASNLKFQRENGLLATSRRTNFSMPKGFKLPEGFEMPGATPKLMKSSK